MSPRLGSGRSFLNCGQLHVPIIIGSSYIDWFIWHIFPVDCLIVHVHSIFVAIVSKYKQAFTSIATTNVLYHPPPVWTDTLLILRGEESRHTAKYRKVWLPLARQKNLPELFFTAFERLNNWLKPLISGVVYSSSYKSFRILIANYSPEQSILPQHMLVDFKMELPEMIAIFPRDSTFLSEGEDKIPMYF